MLTEDIEELIDELRASMRMVADQIVKRIAALEEAGDKAIDVLDALSKQIVQMVKRIAALEEAGDKAIDVLDALSKQRGSPADQVAENWRRVRG